MQGDDHFADLKARSHVKAWGLFFAEITAYIGCIALAVYPLKGDVGILINLIASIAAGFFIGFIFVIGHDCAHDAYFPSKKLNRIIGTLCFVPALHNFALWELFHNKYHHAFTNFKGKDPVWVPRTLTEYNALPPHKRFLERLYRTPVGAGIYYIIEMWAKLFFIPISNKIKRGKRKYWRDTALMLALYTLHTVGIFFLAHKVGTTHSSLGVLLLGIVIPFVMWNYLMGFTVYMHHTHPTIPWVSKQEEWDYKKIQLESSIRSMYPQPLQTLYINIMEHTAHHLMADIPLYNLKAAQRQLEAANPNRITVITHGFRSYLAATKICKLYNFDTHQWTDFKGRVLATIPVNRLQDMETKAA